MEVARLRASVPFCIVFMGLARLAFASDPQEQFHKAENAFKFQDYVTAERLLRPLLHPRVVLTEPLRTKKAREYLGACYYWLKQYDKMKEEFTALLAMDPDYKLDPFYYPIPLLDRFEALRKKLAELGVIGGQSRTTRAGSAGRKAKGERPCVRRTEIVTKRSYLVAAIPFGVGQFQNGDKTKGILLLSTELAALATNIGTYVAAERLRASDGFYAPSDASKARALRTAQYVSLGVLAGLVVYGVVDAFLNFKPEERRVQVGPCAAPVGRSGALTHGLICVSFKK